VIPNDRVFYPVKPIVGTGVDILPGSELKGKVIVITTTSSAPKDVERVKKIASTAQVSGAKQVVVLYRNPADEAHFKEFHSHAIDFLDEAAVRRIFDTAKTHFGAVDSVVHFTGDYDYNSAFSEMTRKQWDALIGNYLYIPGLMVKESVIAMAPQGALEQPSLFKGTKGTMVIVGPDAPVGKKISGLLRARADVFRGALRPYVATVNQELGDVLGSAIKLHLLLAGSSEGAEPNADRLHASVLSLAAGAALKRNEAIFYVDEAKA
jgi:NAD(P)-dependent dehydrogenase (short-subunit alcohol dehydrogenase family)